MLRGNHTAKIDDKGRLKVPSQFRAYIEEQYGTRLFVTSLSGDYVRIYIGLLAALALFGVDYFTSFFYATGEMMSALLQD